MIDPQDIEQFENINTSITDSIDKLEDLLKTENIENKGFLLSSLSSIKDKMQNGGDLAAEINKLKDYASNR